MAQPRSGPAPGLPRWVVLAASAVIAFHLLAVAVHVLAAPVFMGPNPFGFSLAPAPPFAAAVDDVTRTHYLLPLKMTHNYHFNTNLPAKEEIAFEIRLKDDQGQPLQTLKFPDDQANAWVRHRQGLLAQGLAGDFPVQPRAGEVIPAPHQQVPVVTIWDMAPGGNEWRLREVPEHLVPRDRPVNSPSPTALLLARAYARYACRANGAASAEVVRRWRDPVPPAVLFQPDLPAGPPDEFVSSFGEISVRPQRQPGQ